MTRFLLRVLSLVAVFAVVGCATAAGVSYHHFDPKDGSYWMTVMKDEGLEGQSVTLWRCSNNAGGPACIQARIVGCTDATGCSIRANRITGQVNLDPHYPRIDTPAVSTPKPAQ
jgi:hypothetical protein